MAKGYGTAEWRDDLKRILKRAGLEGRDCVFLLADTQIIQENQLEDINNVLNAGGSAEAYQALYTHTVEQCLCAATPPAPTSSPAQLWALTLTVGAPIMNDRRGCAKPDGR